MEEQSCSKGLEDSQRVARQEKVPENGKWDTVTRTSSEAASYLVVEVGSAAYLLKDIPARGGADDEEQGSSRERERADPRNKA